MNKVSTENMEWRGTYQNKTIKKDTLKSLHNNLKHKGVKAK